MLYSCVGGFCFIYDFDLYIVNFFIMRMYFYYFDKYCKFEMWVI